MALGTLRYQGSVNFFLLFLMWTSVCFFHFNHVLRNKGQQVYTFFYFLVHTALLQLLRVTLTLVFLARSS